MEKTRQLANAPLVFVIAAVRFESLEALPGWIPAIQDEVRKILPVFRRMRQKLGPSGFEIQLDPSDFDVSQPHSCWLFSSSDHKTIATLFRTGVVLHTTAYTVFPNFAATYKTLLDALVQAAGSVNVNQIGIRYVDHIQPQFEMDVGNFIVERVLPRPDPSDLVVQSSSSFLSFETPEGSPNATLNVRITVGGSGPVIPPDLLPALAVSGPLGDGSFNYPHLAPGAGVLDLDAVDAELGGRSLSSSEMVAVVDRLHGVANAYFRELTTSEAMRAWSTPPARA